MTDPIRTLIADDEPLARRQFRALLQRDPQINIVGEASTGSEARWALRELKPELLFLDVRMPQGDGFSVLEDASPRPYVIFATAHAEHAVRAFEVEAVDYLLKPFDDDRFERALARAKEVIRSHRVLQLAKELARSHGLTPTAPATPPIEPPRLTVFDGQRTSWVAATDIDWMEAADYYVQVSAHGRTHLVREPLQRLEERFGPKFLRVHRSAMVNVERIQRLERSDEGDLIIVMRDGKRVPVSRSRRAQVGKQLGLR
jgi:two-component system LytT family response regulator